MHGHQMGTLNAPDRRHARFAKALLRCASWHSAKVNNKGVVRGSKVAFDGTEWY